MHLLIDADSAFYKAGCANETREYLCILDGQVIETHKFKVDANYTQEETGCEIELYKTAGELKYSIANLRKVLISMLAVDHDSYTIYIGGKGNFRFDYFPEYKSSRKSTDKPIHLQEMKDYLVKKEQAVIVNKEEVDDRVSWEQYNGKDTCIVSIDKDLNNSAGWHYNYDKEILYNVTEKEAQLYFARQLLSGDATDSIPGIKGVGTKTAVGLLPEFRSDWLGFVKQLYLDRGYTEEYLTQMGIALHMRRQPNEIWSLDYDYTCYELD